MGWWLFAAARERDDTEVATGYAGAAYGKYSRNGRILEILMILLHRQKPDHRDLGAAMRFTSFRRRARPIPDNIAFKPLLLFSAWVPKSKPDSDRWSEYYLSILRERFGHIDKVISINPGCDDAFTNSLHNLPNVISIDIVNHQNNSRSDAAGYQLGLRSIRDILDRYSIVMFGHCKGTSHKFDELKQLAEEQVSGCLDLDRIEAAYKEKQNAIYARTASLPCAASHLEMFAKFMSSCRIKQNTVCFTVPYTMFSVSTPLLSDAIQRIPVNVLSSNLYDIGFNRWFFESIFPSLMTSLGGELAFLEPPRVIDQSWPDISYDILPQHNSALVLREFDRLNKVGRRYYQRPIPYVFGSQEAIRNARVKFSLNGIT